MLRGKKLTAGDLFAITQRRWVYVLVPVAICTFAALLVSASVPDMYQSQALIGVVPQRVPDSYVRSTVTLKTEDQIGSISEEIRSRAQLEPIVQELSLYPEERRRLPMQDVMEKMRAAIAVELIQVRGEPVTAFTVSFTYPDAAIAARVTEKLAGLFVDRNARERGNLAAATSGFLEVQLREAKERLDAQDRKLQGFRERHAGRLPSQQDFNLQAIQSNQAQLQSMVESLARDRDRKLVLEALYKAALAEPAPISGVPVPQRADSDASGATPTLSPRQQLQIARVQLATLQAHYTADHPDVRRQERRVEELERKVAQEPETASDAQSSAAAVTQEELNRRDRLRQMHADIESADRQIAFKEAEEQRLRKLVAEYQARLEAVPGLESEWVQLTRDYDTQQQSYRDLLSKSEQSKVSLELELRQIGEQFRIIDPARIPVRPVGPMRLQINGIGAGLGLALGLALIALLELRDSSFRTEAEVLDILALPVLALVPQVETESERTRRAHRRWALSSGVALVTVACGYVFWVMRLWRHII